MTSGWKPVGIDGGRQSGYVIVVLADLVRPPGSPVVDATDQATDLRTAAKFGGLRDVDELLTQLGSPPTQRQITSVAPAELRRQEQVARGAEPDTSDPSLTRFWRVDLTTGKVDPAAAAAAFAALKSVRKAYAEIAVDRIGPAGRHQRLVDAVDTTTAGPATAGPDMPGTATAGPSTVRVAAHVVAPTGFGDAAPTGVGVVAGRGGTGGLGENTGLVDVEQTWRLSHPDLKAYDQPPLCNTNLDPGLRGDHGNGVVGILAGDDPVVGLSGLAPSVARLHIASHVQGAVPHHVADAIAAARTVLQPGDVLLLEVTRGERPTEIDYCDFVAIRDTVRMGFVVVEAAGNGGPQRPPQAKPGVGDLDAWSTTDLETGKVRRMVRDDPDNDSRAIVVGSSRSSLAPAGAGQGHRRFPTSNFGTRVDCYAWGEDVVTCAASGYQLNFGGTSAAAAIVAGVAVLAQSIRIGAGGVPLTGEQMRRILPAGGTPQAPDPVFARPMPVGTLPDLAVIAGAVTQAGPP